MVIEWLFDLDPAAFVMMHFILILGGVLLLLLLGQVIQFILWMLRRIRRSDGHSV